MVALWHQGILTTDAMRVPVKLISQNVTFGRDEVFSCHHADHADHATIMADEGLLDVAEALAVLPSEGERRDAVRLLSFL